jgi:hypothetical protein
MPRRRLYDGPMWGSTINHRAIVRDRRMVHRHPAI